VDVVTYKPQTAKLVVVSVNGNATSTNELKAYLNDVYGKVGVTFEVETDTFTYNNAISFFDRSSGWFSRYTAAMKAFNIAYRENIGERYDSDKNYLFILGEDSSRSDRDAQGFMPLGGRFGYLFKNQIPDNQINSIAAHELGHGIWALKHTFDNDYGNIAVNTTDNLMDYTPQANHLAKWQWEIIRYPALFTDPFGGDEEGMVYSIEEIRTLFETIRTSNNKLTPGIANVPIIVRFQDIVDDIHFADSASNLATDFSKEEFLASFTHEQSLKLADTLKDRVVDTSSNLPTDYNPIILANKAKITIGGKTYKVTLNGYAMTEQIYTTHIADDIINEEHRLIFFNANRITSKEKNAYKTNTNLTEVKNIRKSFEIIVHDSIGYGTSEDLKQYLKIKGVFDLSRTPTLTDGLIVLKLRRLYSTDFITIGELTADGDSSVQLVTVELRKTENCAENNSILPKNEKSRVCAGTYDFELNTQEYSTAPQHRYKSLRLHTLGTSTGGLRDGILVHTGWDYSFTDGCILTLNVRDVENVINNPQDFLNSITTGKIKNISEEPISHETIITFEKERKATKEGQQIELKGVTGYTGYNDTFTIVRRIDDKTIIINKQFHQEANVNSATFKIFTTGDYLVGSNWNYSAPATISLYEYVEKYVPDGVVKGRIIITEIGENINITPQFVQQSYINVLDYLLEIIEDSMN
jgi:hypothetical protein